MTPEQKLKHAMLRMFGNQDHIPTDLSADQIEEKWEELAEKEEHWDCMSEMRGGEVETGLKCDWSRHYESKSVAAKMVDGSWVGWTYWYGGGKHGEPEAIDWMDRAYDLNCKEEEKMVVVRTFTKVEADQPA